MGSECRSESSRQHAEETLPCEAFSQRLINTVRAHCNPPPRARASVSAEHARVTFHKHCAVALQLPGHIIIIIIVIIVIRARTPLCDSEWNSPDTFAAVGRAQC